MIEAERLFEDALDWLRATYDSHGFFHVERDVVWTVQKRLTVQVAALQLPLRVFNDYPMVPAKNRSLSADLCLVGAQGSVDVAAEFKFEPAHARGDVQKQKLPVVFWGMDGVGKDVQRVRDYVEHGKARVAYSVFIDEGGAFRHREAHPGSSWIDWESGRCILYSKATSPAG